MRCDGCRREIPGGGAGFGSWLTAYLTAARLRRCPGCGAAGRPSRGVWLGAAAGAAFGLALFAAGAWWLGAGAANWWVLVLLALACAELSLPMFAMTWSVGRFTTGGTPLEELPPNGSRDRQGAQ